MCSHLGQSPLALTLLAWPLMPPSGLPASLVWTQKAASLRPLQKNGSDPSDAQDGGPSSSGSIGRRPGPSVSHTHERKGQDPSLVQGLISSWEIKPRGPAGFFLYTFPSSKIHFTVAGQRKASTKSVTGTPPLESCSMEKKH